MNIFIDNRSGSPIYDQIYTEIKAMIMNGTLKEGEMLPSIRSLAKDLRISVITTKRAYEELEKEGFVYSLPGKGFYVAEKNGSLLREEILRMIEEKFSEAIALARGAGVTGEELTEMLGTMMEEE